jgi:hypothetical protein
LPNTVSSWVEADKIEPGIIDVFKFVARLKTESHFRLVQEGKPINNTTEAGISVRHQRGRLVWFFSLIKAARSRSGRPDAFGKNPADGLDFEEL